MKIMLVILMLAMASPCFAGKTYRFYNNRGDYSGMVRDTEANIQYFDKKGRYLGRSAKNIDGSLSTYSRDGKFEGKVTCTDGCNVDEPHEDGDE